MTSRVLSPWYLKICNAGNLPLTSHCLKGEPFPIRGGPPSEPSGYKTIHSSQWLRWQITLILGAYSTKVSRVRKTKRNKYVQVKSCTFLHVVVMFGGLATHSHRCLFTRRCGRLNQNSENVCGFLRDDHDGFSWSFIDLFMLFCAVISVFW